MENNIVITSNKTFLNYYIGNRLDRRIGIRQWCTGQRQEDRHQPQVEGHQHDDNDFTSPQVQVRMPERL